MGVINQIRFFDTIHFADETGRRADMYATALPSPLHLASAMMHFSLLTLPEKAELGRAMLALKLLGSEGRLAMEGIPFESFLRDQGQSPRLIERFWNVVLVSALNADAAHASAKYGMQVFQESFLGHRGGYRMALSTVPLARLYHSAVASEQIIGTRVVALLNRQGRVTGAVLADGRTLPADHVVLATAPDSARHLLAELSSQIPAARDVIDRLDQLQFGPIIGAHLWYDRPVMDLPHLALVGTRLQWLFRKDETGRRLHGVVSNAESLASLDQSALTELFDREIRALLPSARNAQLTRALIVKEKRATFIPAPGLDALRPTQQTTIPGLTLAGDYTQTDWPATMEGAVRSGYLAADSVSPLPAGQRVPFM